MLLFIKKIPIFAQINLTREGTRKCSLFSFIGIEESKHLLNDLTVIEHKIPELLEEKFQEVGFTDFFLVELKVGINNKVEVFIDSDSSVTFEKCQKISRFLESHIDEEGWLGEKYTLEVSSPGITRPLKFLRQYIKNLGRKVEVTTETGTQKGKLVAATEEMVTLENEERVKVGKKKVKQTVQTEIPMAQIAKTIVKISFN